MSIVIARAYRLKKSSDFWPLVQDTQKLGELAVRAKLQDVFLSLMESVDEGSDAYQARLKEGRTEASARASTVDKAMYEMYRISSTAASRSAFDFDVSVGFWHYRGRVYLVPFCDMHMSHVLDFLNEDSRLEDYFYDDRADRPDEISASDWTRRGKVWRHLTDPSNWDQNVVLELCSFGRYYRMNPYYELSQSGKIRDWVKPANVAGTIRASLDSSEAKLRIRTPP
jgi:hypothetical protein